MSRVLTPEYEKVKVQNVWKPSVITQHVVFRDSIN